MSFAEFLNSTTAEAAPAELSLALQALWHDAHEQWDEAHDLAQEAGDRDGAWVHAYLHRKEGDETNAAYWYQRAGRPVSRADARIEWETIVRSLLAAQP
jgi:hypothetical protein